MPSTGNIRLAHKGIAALEALRRADRAHGGDDQQALAGWPGWGPFAPAFETELAEEWVPVAERLADLLDDEAYETAKLCVDNSFYTSPAVVDLVYRLLAETGAGEEARTRPLRALEPGCGSGRFIARAPAGWRLEWTGIEADKTSAAVAQALHPEARVVHKRLERLAVPDDSFDLAVGNVPFSSQHVFDPVGQEYLSLHNYFIDRALAAVHDGGYLAFVISRFAMDGQEILSVLQGKAALVGAIRLPSGTFRSEGTNVVADLVFIRKGVDMAGWRPRAGAAKLLVPGPTPDVLPASVSSYWAEHPEHVAGRMVASKHFRNGLRVDAGPEPDRDLERAVSSLAAELSARPWQPGNVAPAALEVVTDDEGRPEGSFVLAGGKLCQVVGGQLSEVRRAGAELRALVELRDAAEALLELEADLDLPDSALDGPRAKARVLYEAYVARYGPLNRGSLHEGAPDPDTGMATLSWRRPPMGGFRRDPGYITVLALEHFDQDTGEARPAAILTGRVNRRPIPIESAETPAEALAVTLGETGNLDLGRVASLLGLAGPDEAASALGDLVYADPAQGGSYVPARDYLSGNVRAKLAATEQAAANDPRFERNVAALRSVLPPPLGPLEITVHLGAPWVGAKDIEAFLADVLGRSATVENVAATASWKVCYSKWGCPAAATTTWGTSRLNAYQLVEMALNGRTPVVYDEVWDGSTTRKVRNQEQTLAAIEKMAALDERFGTWVWEDAERSERICAEYNHRFNSHVLRKADGSHLRFPGLSAGVVPWRWQRDVVDRIVSTSPGTFCAHDVGLGKTLTMVLAAHTLRRFGLVNKPLIVVPNHLLEQIAREAAQAFPLNRYLVTGKEDLAGDARRLFAARCATEDWDAVIMTHQGFTSLPVHPATEIAWLNEQKAELEDYLRSEGRSYSAKDIARALRSLQGRLEQLRDGVADRGTILFDQLGIDWIAVDECSAFRRLPIGARADGFSLGSSKRATDLLLKSQAIARRKPGMPCLALFSGTPWNNTLAEVFVWQTFLQPERLKEVGVSNFNAWAATFVKRETRVEVAPDGSGFRLATRPVGLQNLPELRSMFTEFMDIVHADATGIERPDAIVENVRALPSASQVAYVKGLVRRADKIRSGGVDRDKDNMLVVCNDGRKVALDPRLVGLDEPSPKLVAVADKVAEIYEETAEWDYDGSTQRGTLQVVFCDQGTPGANGAQSYGRLRSMLVDRGVPASRVRWAHEAGTDKAKAALFAACREGKVAVLLASTEKAGLGTNIQTRLCAVHHVDAPWLPSLVAQRDGRAIRYGNMNEKVRIFRYVTEGTFDAYMWQALERKARSFQEISRSDSDVREIDDIGETVLSYGEVKALATGNPLVLRQAEIAATVKRLRTIKAVESQGVTSAKRTMADASGRAKILAERAQALGKVGVF
jgi:N12 class adenine-specific DNA methylase